MRHNVREHGHLTHLDILVRASLKQRLHYVQMSTVCSEMQWSIPLATSPFSRDMVMHRERDSHCRPDH